MLDLEKHKVLFGIEDCIGVKKSLVLRYVKEMKENLWLLASVGTKKACPKAIAIVQLHFFLKEMKNYGQLKGRKLTIQEENLSIRTLSIMG